MHLVTFRTTGLCLRSHRRLPSSGLPLLKQSSASWTGREIYRKVLCRVHIGLALDCTLTRHVQSADPTVTILPTVGRPYSDYPSHSRQTLQWLSFPQSADSTVTILPTVGRPYSDYPSHNRQTLQWLSFPQSVDTTVTILSTVGRLYSD